MASQSDKKEEFRKYLERKKVLDVLTRALTDLFELESRPDNALEYLYDRLGESLKRNSDGNGDRETLKNGPTINDPGVGPKVSTSNVSATANANDSEKAANAPSPASSQPPAVIATE